MGYGLKYYADLTDSYGVACRVTIEGKDYAGDSSEISMSESPVITRSADDVFSALLTTSVQLSVWSETNYKYEDLFMAAPGEYRVTVIRNNKVLFVGFVEPGLYEEEFIAAPYTVYITATDGLKALENYHQPAFGYATKADLLTIVKNCLLDAVVLPINICNSVFAKVHDASEGKTLFEQSFIDNEGLTTTSDGVTTIINSKEILSNLLSSFGCRIYQAAGEWYIERIRNRAAGKSTFVRFADDVVSVVNRAHEVILGSDAAPWYSTPSLEVDAGYASQVVKQDISTPESMMFNNYSSGLTQKADYSLLMVDRDKWFRTDSYAHLETFMSQYGIARGVSFVHTLVGVNQTIYQVCDCTLHEGDKINLKFRVAVTATAGTITTSVKVRYTFALGTQNSFDKDGVLIFGNDTIIEKILDVQEDFEGNLSAAVEISLSTKAIPEPLAGPAQSLRLLLYPVSCAETGSEILKCHFGDVELTIDTEKLPVNTFTAKSNKEFWRKAEEVTMSFNDSPVDSVFGGIALYSELGYRNVSNLLVSQHTITIQGYDPYTLWRGLKGWYDSAVEDSTTARQLAEQLLQDHFSQLYDSRATIGGEIDTTEDLSPLTLFSVDYRPGRYMMIYQKYDLIAGSHEIKVVQVYDQTIAIE